MDNKGCKQTNGSWREDRIDDPGTVKIVRVIYHIHIYRYQKGAVCCNVRCGSMNSKLNMEKYLLGTTHKYERNRKRYILNLRIWIQNYCVWRFFIQAWQCIPTKTEYYFLCRFPNLKNFCGLGKWYVPCATPNIYIYL